MRAQNRRHRAELTPARVGFLVAPAVMPTDIVRPEETADVARRRSEGHFKGEHIPARVGVARKVNRVAMIAPTRPARKRGAAPPVLSRVAHQQLR